MTVQGGGVWKDDPSRWPTFAHVRCHIPGAIDDQPTVNCTFHESDAPDAGQVDDFWSVEFVRSGGRWLVDNWGQG
jgi:hypothetical protein